MSIPILIHLLTRRQQKHVRFSAVYLLSQSQKRSIKKSNPNRLLLLLLRCMGIALLSLALAGPFFSFGDAFRSNAPSSYVFIVDDSFSMRSRIKEKTLFESAIQFLSNLLTKIPEGSEFSLVLASHPARTDQDWIAQKNSFEKLIHGLQPSYQTTDIGHAFEKATHLLSTASKKEKNLILLTDMNENGWDKEVFSEVSSLLNTPLQIFDFSTLAIIKNQVSVESVEIHQEFLARSRILKIKTKIKNHSQSSQRLPVSLIFDKKIEKETLIDVPVGQTITKEFSIPLHSGDAIRGKIKAGEDALATDDIRYFSHQPNQNIKVLVVDGDPGTVSHQSESFYLERALNPFSVSVSHIDPTVSTLAELPLRNLSDFSVVIFANVRELPVGYELKLENFVLHGGALIFGMGDQINAKYYNEKLGNLLPVTLEAVQKFKKTHLLFENNQHPVMQAFSAKTIKEMKEIPFHSIYTIQTRDEKSFKVASWFTNKNPAILESDSGKGKVIVFLSSLDRDWNDFPIQPTFLPWIQRWTQYATRGLENFSQQDLLIGETFTQKIDKPNGQWAVQTPGGNLHLTSTTDGKTRFNKTDLPGVYTLFELPDETLLETITKLPLGAQPIGSFNVNIDTKESSPQKLSNIKTFLPNLKVEIKNPELGASQLPASEGMRFATPLFLFVVGILLLEGWMIRKE